MTGSPGRRRSARAPRGSACGGRPRRRRSRAGRSTETNATFEKRGHADRRAPATRRAAGRLRQSDEQPDRARRARSSRRRGGASRAASASRAARSARRDRGARDDSTAAAAASAPTPASSSAIERCSRSGRSTQMRDQAATHEEREAELEVDVAAAERGHPEERHERADVEERPQRVDRGRLLEVDRDRDQPERPRDRERDRERAQARPGDAPHDRPRDRDPHDEAARSPSSRVRNIEPACATSSGVVVAVREMCGIVNCGAGPGFGPTANVNAPCTGCPSTEIARQ